jgi:hypothetical protein
VQAVGNVSEESQGRRWTMRYGRIKRRGSRAPTYVGSNETYWTKSAVWCQFQVSTHDSLRNSQKALIVNLVFVYQSLTMVLADLDISAWYVK